MYADGAPILSHDQFVARQFDALMSMVSKFNAKKKEQTAQQATLAILESPKWHLSCRYCDHGKTVNSVRAFASLTEALLSTTHHNCTQMSISHRGVTVMTHSKINPISGEVYPVFKWFLASAATQDAYRQDVIQALRASSWRKLNIGTSNIEGDQYGMV